MSTDSKYLKSEIVRLYAKGGSPLPIAPSDKPTVTKIYNYDAGWPEALHYEFWIRGGRIEVALHTENEKSKNALYSQMRSWEHTSPKPYPHKLRYEKRSAKYSGLSTAFDISTDPKVIVNAMKLFIQATSPVITQLMNDYPN